MTDNGPIVLLDYLTRHYASLKQRISRQLGNPDLASDALQDTWLRVQSREETEPIHSPAGYLTRIAVNIAVDIQRREGKSLPIEEVDALQALADPTPGPAQVAEDRSELNALMSYMARMPERRRQVLMLTHVEGMGQKEVAERLGISLRTVTTELQKAHAYLNTRMNHDPK